MKELTWNELLGQLVKENQIIVSAHISPDADAVGSSLGLALGLKKLGKEVILYLQDEIPNRLKGLLVSDVKIVHKISEIDFNNFKTLVVVDTASKSRVGKEIDEILKNVTVSYNIDHHISNDRWAKYNFINAQAPASAVIVCSILSDLKVSFDEHIGNLLYAGLLDDTGRFCFSNTNTLAFECAKGLLEKGAKPNKVSNQLYGSMPLKKIKLQSEVLGSLQIFENGKIALLSISNKTLESFQAEPDDADGLVDLVRNIQGVEVAVLQREIEEGWKFSLRAKREELDVNQVARVFGGGGHKAAAGCKVVGEQKEVARKVVSEIKKILK